MLWSSSWNMWIYVYHILYTLLTMDVEHFVFVVVNLDFLYILIYLWIAEQFRWAVEEIVWSDRFWIWGHRYFDYPLHCQPWILPNGRSVIVDQMCFIARQRWVQNGPNACLCEEWWIVYDLYRDTSSLLSLCYTIHYTAGNINCDLLQLVGGIITFHRKVN